MNCRTHRSSTPRTHIAVGSTLPTTSVSGSFHYQSRRVFWALLALDVVGLVSLRRLKYRPGKGLNKNHRVVANFRSSANGQAAFSWKGSSPRRMRPQFRELLNPLSRRWRLAVFPLQRRKKLAAERLLRPIFFIILSRPEIGRGYPLNLSISLSGGKETNKDSLSNGE